MKPQNRWRVGYRRQHGWVGRVVERERLVSPLRPQLQQPLGLLPGLRDLTHQSVRRRANPPRQLAKIDLVPLIAFFGPVPIGVQEHPSGGRCAQELCEHDGVDDVHVPVLSSR